MHLNIDGIFLVRSGTYKWHHSSPGEERSPTGTAQGLKSASLRLENVKHFPCLLPFAEERWWKFWTRRVWYLELSQMGGFFELTTNKQKRNLNKLRRLSVIERAQNITWIIKESWTLKRPPAFLKNPSKDNQVYCLKLTTTTDIQEAKAVVFQQPRGMPSTQSSWKVLSRIHRKVSS